MGENNSSETRVAPLGKFLLENHDKINDLLSLIGCGDVDFGDFCDDDVWFSEKVNGKTLRSEKSLPPPLYHLEGIIHAVCSQEEVRAFFMHSVKEAMRRGTLKEKSGNMRLDFAAGLISEQDAVQAVHEKKRWATMEAASHPDLFIENEDFILLVEGKLTEPSTTKEVLYVAGRSQMVRHIQNTIAYLEGKGEDKKIIAFYILPENFKSISGLKQKQAIEKEMEDETIPISASVRKKIAAAYYGCTTWEAVSDRLGIEFSPIKAKR